MPKLGLLGLPRCPPRDRKLLRTRRFETKDECRQEDLRRSRQLLRASVVSNPLVDPVAAKRLAKQMGHSEAGKSVGTLASRRFCRFLRKRLTSALLRFFRRFPPHQVTTFTLVCEAWTLTPEQLVDWDPVAMLKAVATDLYRCGVGKLDGGIFLAIHGDFEPTRRLFQLHIHGAVFGNKVKAVNRLRKRRKYRPVGGEAPGTLPIKRPVRIDKAPLTEPERPLSYTFKSFWLMRPLYRNAKGKLRRRKRGVRIPEPYHSLYLQWLDRWSILDVTLLIGMRASAKGFVLTGNKPQAF